MEIGGIWEVATRPNAVIGPMRLVNNGPIEAEGFCKKDTVTPFTFSSDTMIAHSKPIALPNTNNSQLAYAEGFYTGDSTGAFNPASFTRHFLGSPISWRVSSFTNRFPASPTAQLLSSIEYVFLIIVIVDF